MQTQELENKSRFRVRNNNPSKNSEDSNSYKDLLLRDPSYGVTPRRGTKAYVKYNDKQGNRKYHDRQPQRRNRSKVRPSKSEDIPREIVTNDVIPLAEQPIIPSVGLKSLKLKIKKFDPSSRPEAPSLLKKIRDKTKKNINEDENRESQLRGKKLKEIFDNTFESLIEDNKPLPEFLNNNIGLSHNALVSTLDVSTIFPDHGSTYLKVATIKSPYSFDLIDDEGVKMSTRFVTVTRTFTSTIEATSLDVAPALSIIEPTAASFYDSYYQTENVLSPHRSDPSSGFK